MRVPLTENDVVCDAALVRRLLEEQFPRLADRPLVTGPRGGTDHLLFRLGPDLLVRMPQRSWSGEDALRDARWLPRLAPHLPAALPAPVAVGTPTAYYPFHWSVVPWLPGRPPTSSNSDPLTLARQLGEFVTALRAVDPADGPVKAPGMRGGALAAHHDAVLAAIVACGDRIDQAGAIRVWNDARDAAPPAARTWIHGDLLPGNMLVSGGALSGVIDWGALGVGDPAVDLFPAWTHGWDDDARDVFRRAAAPGLPDPEDAWRRGRGWVLVMCVVAIPFYWESFPEFALASQARVAALTATA